MPLLPKKANCEGNNETLGDRSPLPAGSYIVAMKTSDYKETKSKNGHYLSVMFVVIEGPHKGRTLFTNLNLDNPNPVAVEIAYKELNSICEACGMVGVEDSAELYGIPLVVDVKVDKKENSDFPPGNSITNYKKPEGEARRSVFQDATEEQSATTATEKQKKKKPWEK